MTLTVDAAKRQSIVPLQQSASSRLTGGFGPRFVTGSQYYVLIMRLPTIDNKKMYGIIKYYRSPY